MGAIDLNYMPVNTKKVFEKLSEASFIENYTLVGGTTDNVGDNVGDNRPIEIMTLIKRNNQISAKQLAKQLSVSDRTIERDIEKLKKQGKLKRIGTEKNGHWKLTV